MNKPSDSILILGNLEAMFGILHCIEHRSHGLGDIERTKLEPAIQDLNTVLGRATHALIEALDPDEPWNIKR